MKKHIHDDKTKHMLYALYVMRNDKWLKIGELCEGCGFHIDKDILKENLGLPDSSLKFAFDGFTVKNVSLE